MTAQERDTQIFNLLVQMYNDLNAVEQLNKRIEQTKHAIEIIDQQFRNEQALAEPQEKEENVEIKE